jgi:enoyl-CoA hydratase/carnithine racemase
MTYNDIIYSTEDHVATITLNRPERMNAMDGTASKELTHAIGKAEKDKEVRVLILTGAGRAFCAGADVGQMVTGGGLAATAKAKRLHRLGSDWQFGGGDALLYITKPTIAAVNGAAVGYGFDLALLCDMRIASDKARFRGFLQMGILTHEDAMILPRLVGLARAYEFLLSGDMIDATEADRIGMVNKVVPHDQLMTAAKELADKIAKNPPLTVRMTKEAVHKGLALPIELFRTFWGQASVYLTETEDHREAAKAFKEKREPVFKGK